MENVDEKGRERQIGEMNWTNDEEFEEDCSRDHRMRRLTKRAKRSLLESQESDSDGKGMESQIDEEPVKVMKNLDSGEKVVESHESYSDIPVNKTSQKPLATTTKHLAVYAKKPTLHIAEMLKE